MQVLQDVVPSNYFEIGQGHVTISAMEPDVVRVKRSPIPVLVVAAATMVIGVMFAYSSTVSWRAVALFPMGIAFFLGCALFVNRLREFLLFLMIFAIPMQFGYHVILQPWTVLGGSSFISGITVDTVDVLLLALYAEWMAAASLGRQSSYPLSMGGNLGILFFLWIVYLLAASLFVSTQFRYSLFEIVVLFKGFLLFFYLVNNLNSVRDLKVVLYGLFANTVSHALYIGFQYATGLNYTVHGEPSRHYVALEGFRPIGFAGSWDAAAILLANVLPIMITYGLVVKERMPRLNFFLMALLVSGGLALTKTRASWLAVLVSTALVIGVCYLRKKIHSAVLVKLGVIIAVLLIFSSPFTVHRLVTGTRGENRMPLIYTAVDMFRGNWLVGVGVNNYFVHIEEYLPPSLRGSWEFTVHNEYLLWLSETGIIGFCLYYAVLLLALKKLWAGTRWSHPWVFAASLGFFSALIGSLPNRIFAFYHFLPTFGLYCVILALASGMERIGLGSEDSEETAALSHR